MIEKALAQKKIRSSAIVLLNTLGQDLTDPNNMDTPQRIALSYTDALCRGLFEPEPVLKTFPSTGYDEMILVKDIDCYSLCSHHYLPFLGKAYIAYIPDKQLLGLSKINRWVDWMSRRPTIQEQLTQGIAQGLYERLQPKGVAVVIKAYHLCMMIRGVKQKGFAVTSCLVGAFKEHPETRQEFFDLVEGDNGRDIWK